jgi:hypothetical protein
MQKKPLMHVVSIRPRLHLLRSVKRRLLLYFQVSLSYINDYSSFYLFYSRQ